MPILLLAACDTLPRDTDGTLDRVRAAHEVRIGMTDEFRVSRPAIDSLVRHVSAAADARAMMVRGTAEPLLAALEEGQVDLVIGAWIEKTPWTTDVSLTPPIARRMVGETVLELRGAVRNGENRWAMLVEHAARETAKQAHGR